MATMKRSTGESMLAWIRKAALALALAGLCGAAAADRPAQWAQPIDARGVPDMYQITPFLFRSARPTAEGMRVMDELGIRTVIDLCGYQNDHKLLAGTRLQQVRIPIDPREIGDAEIVAVLRKLKRVKDGPFLIHCQQGTDQTALVAAMYRIVVEDWTRDAAIDEMLHGGFARQRVRKSIVSYIRHVDVARVRKLVDK
jgi:protein tyrosine/serine phosphatase